MPTFASSKTENTTGPDAFLLYAEKVSEPNSKVRCSWQNATGPDACLLYAEKVSEPNSKVRCSWQNATGQLLELVCSSVESKDGVWNSRKTRAFLQATHLFCVDLSRNSLNIIAQTHHRCCLTIHIITTISPEMCIFVHIYMPCILQW